MCLTQLPVLFDDWSWTNLTQDNVGKAHLMNDISGNFKQIFFWFRTSNMQKNEWIAECNANKDRVYKPTNTILSA